MTKIFFHDRDGKTFVIVLRGRYSRITTERKLKSIIDRSTSTEGLKELHPTWPAGLHERMSATFSTKPYMWIMREFGMLSASALQKEPK